MPFSLSRIARALVQNISWLKSLSDYTSKNDNCLVVWKAVGFELVKREAVLVKGERLYSRGQSGVWTLNIGFRYCLIQEAFLDTLSDGNHHSYPVSCSSSGKHIEYASCPFTPMQKVKQGFCEDSSCLCAVYLHLFYCNL